MYAIERYDGTGLTWLTTEPGGWTRDIAKSLRFADKEFAKGFAQNFGAYVVNLHERQLAICGNWVPAELTNVCH